MSVSESPVQQSVGKKAEQPEAKHANTERNMQTPRRQEATALVIWASS